MIEIVKTDDFSVLAELNEEIQTFHHKIHPKIFKPYNKETILNFFKTTVNSENAAAYLAKENGTTVGYVLLFNMNSADNPFQFAKRYVLLDQILVLKNHQGKGIGKLLLEAVFSFAKANNVNLVELNHWTQNDSARKFFNKNKFEYYNEKMWRVIE